MPLSLETLRDHVCGVAPTSVEWTVRAVARRDETIAVRRNAVEPVRSDEDEGALVSVAARGGVGFAGTVDLSRDGLGRAFAAAADWACRAGRLSLDPAPYLPQPVDGRYESPVHRTWQSESMGDKLMRLEGMSRILGTGEDIVDWGVSLWRTEIESFVIGSRGGTSRQRFDYLVPMMSATASWRGESQTRTFGGHARVRQGGLEVLTEVGFWDAAAGIRERARELVRAPNCPSAATSVVLAPDQMILQIHESIGHPLELDRILGDERNYAGSSFVTPDMFGTYRYGSEYLNIDFDPTVAGELATYGFDDDGQPAERTAIIRDGILLRPLGGRRSQRRAAMSGVANSRAASWNRPTIDRIANLNLAPGSASLDDLIGGIESGIYMETNRSWSIDDARNKFQFGCELGRVIRDGVLAEVVKNPNYRGISSTFWRSLDGVGAGSTVRVLGTPFCGKGEPNQIIRVGHASPACRFRDVDVFGGE